jgi:hypothetical protein
MNGLGVRAAGRERKAADRGMKNLLGMAVAETS